MLADLRYAVRALLRTPGFTLVAVGCLALGIGANAAIFSAVRAVLLRPVAVEGIDQLVVVRDDLAALDLRSIDVSPPEVEDLAARRDLFRSVAGFASTSYNLTGAGDPARVAAVRTLGDFFGTFGVRPAVGRLYRPEDSRGGQHLQAVLSHAFWQERFGGDRAVVGRSLELSGRTYEVVGVLPPQFRYPRSAQVLVPFAIDSNFANLRGSQFVTAIGRLQPGVTIEQLRTALVGEALRWRERYPGSNYAKWEHALLAVPFVDFVAGQLRPVLLVLTGAVAFVLLIACANVASLQLVRTAGRSKEIAVRGALGAGRGRVVRQILVENAVLALAGGAAGLLLGYVATRLIARWAPVQHEVLQDVGLDAAVLAFATLAALLSGALFGVAPALETTRVDLQETLKEGTRGSSVGAGRGRLLQGAVVAQVALTLVLLLGSGVMIRSLARLLAVDPGFRPERVLTLRVSLPPARYPGPQVTAFYDGLVERLGALPGVQAVGITSDLPFTGGGDSSPFEVIGRPSPAGDSRPHANLHVASDGYFRTLGVPLLRGRLFAGTDREGAPLVAVIDEQLARQYFPGEDPIGQQISHGQPATIVGVVGTVRQAELSEALKPTVYYAYQQRSWVRNMAVVARSTLPAATVATMVRGAVAEADKNVPVYDVKPMPERIAESVGARRFGMVVLSGFAGLSLLLAVLGIYGVLSYAVSQRTRELGIRVALGAQAGEVAAMVVRGGLALTAVGLAVGTFGFLALGRALDAVLYGVGPRDPLTMIAGALLLALAALLASYLPARRATRVDPMAALRSE